MDHHERLELSLSAWKAEVLPIYEWWRLVEVDGVAPPELSQLIYSQLRYYLRYKLPW